MVGKGNHKKQQDGQKAAAIGGKRLCEQHVHGVVQLDFVPVHIVDVDAGSYPVRRALDVFGIAELEHVTRARLGKDKVHKTPALGRCLAQFRHIVHALLVGRAGQILADDLLLRGVGHTDGALVDIEVARSVVFKTGFFHIVRDDAQLILLGQPFCHGRQPQGRGVGHILDARSLRGKQLISGHNGSFVDDAAGHKEGQNSHGYGHGYHKNYKKRDAL